MALSVVVIGGGFGGLSAARALAKHSDISVLVIDRRNHHLFQPLLYQVATAGLSPADIATPIRSVFSNSPNVKVVMDQVVDVDRQKKIVKAASGSEYTYDRLIVATGAVHSYFGHDDWEEAAPGLKTLEQATEVRRRILMAFEDAEKEKDPQIKEALMTFVIVGAGPTGVEMAGSIAEISRTTLESDFRNIDPRSAKVYLIDAGDRVLGGFDPDLSQRAQKDLERMGVQVILKARVSSVTAEGVRYAEQFIPARTSIWAAGVEASALGRRLGGETDRSGRAKVGADLSLQNDPNVFVIGDLAWAPTADGRGYPGLAPVAIQQGRQTAKNIVADLHSKPRKAFEYVDKGMMATIGRRRAVMQSGKLKAGGAFAWMAWLFIHIFYLIGFRNRVFVFLQWMWSYVTFKRGARLIALRDWKLDHEPPSSTAHLAETVKAP